MGNPLEKRGFGYGLEDLELVLGLFCAAGISWNAPDDLRNRILAAMLSYELGNKSIDYTLKTCKDISGFQYEQNELVRLTYEITEIIKFEIKNELQRSDIYNEQATAGYYVAKAALLRLWNTFITAIYTIRNAYHFEAAQLQKLILERLAWAFAVKDYKDDEFLSIKPSKCIASLKSIFPQAGNLYGLFNSLGHIEPEATKRYITVTQNGVTVIFTSFENSKLDAWHLLLLCDVFLILSEYVSRDLLSEHKYICLMEDGEIVLNPERKILDIQDKYRSLLLSE